MGVGRGMRKVDSGLVADGEFKLTATSALLVGCGECFTCEL